MISMSELLKGRDQEYPDDYTQDVQDNLAKLLDALNVIRAAYAKPMTVNSGWRPPSVNAATPGAASHSAHCQGLAADIADPDGEVMKWVLENLQLMKDNGFYFEDFRWTTNWVHFGLRRPASGKRIFVPNANRAQSPDRWDGQYDVSYDC